MPADLLLFGGLAVAAASFLGGVSGFGYGLVSTPLLLIVGLPLHTVVVVNLALALVTRLVVVYRFREWIARRRVLLLVLGSVPGLYLGSRVLGWVDTHILRIALGCLVVVLAPLLMRRRTEGETGSLTAPSLTAGFAGGLLGATTSLNGVPVVMLLSRSGLPPRNFIADLAGYFVASNLVGIFTLTVGTGTVSPGALRYFLVWLPASILANTVGTLLGPRLPVGIFRKITLVIIVVAGLVTALTP